MFYAILQLARTVPSRVHDKISTRVPEQKFYHGPGRGQIENPKLGMKHTAWLGPDWAFRDPISLLSRTDRARPGPDRAVFHLRSRLSLEISLRAGMFYKTWRRCEIAILFLRVNNLAAIIPWSCDNEIKFRWSVSTVRSEIFYYRNSWTCIMYVTLVAHPRRTMMLFFWKPLSLTKAPYANFNHAAILVFTTCF